VLEPPQAAPVVVEDLEGTVALATDRAREAETVAAPRLGAAEGVVVRL